MVVTATEERAASEGRLVAERLGAVQAERRVAVLERLDDDAGASGLLAWLERMLLCSTITRTSARHRGLLPQRSQLVALARWGWPMSINSIVPVPPAVAQLEAEFTQLGPSMSSGLPSPSDPFAVLLEAATAPSSTTASMTNPSGTVSVEPQLVSLASSPSQSGALVNSVATAAPASSSGSAIVSEASKFLGVPYVWGGASPSGFDCSGLVQYVFAQLGVEMPHGSVPSQSSGPR